MKKKLSIFFFEGTLLNYPVQEGKEDWMSDPECLYYPHVPDIPGQEAWDHFACGFYGKAMKDPEVDVILLTEIEVPGKSIESRIKTLMKFLKMEVGELMRKRPGEDLKKFCTTNVGYYLTCQKKYEEINLYLKDLELSKDVADFIITEFSTTTIVHDLYSS